MRKLCLVLALVLGSLAAAPFAHAEIYRWTDSQGEKHFTDRMENVPPEYRDQVDEVSGEVRERDEANLTSEQMAERKKMEEAPPPPVPEDEMDAAIQEKLVEIFSEGGVPAPTKEESEGAIELVRVWLAPILVSVLFLLGLAVGLTIHALMNGEWLWAIGSLFWFVLATFFARPMEPAAVFEAPLLWSALSYTSFLPVIVYPPFKVGEEDREYLKWLLPLLAVCAIAIAAAGAAEGIGWMKGVMDARGIEIPTMPESN